MASPSNIEWTNFTWNPTTGCTKVSAGCKHCYAERWATMHEKRGIKQYKHGFEFTLAENRLFDPLKLKGNQTIFVNSMSDLFHPNMPDEFLKKVFAVMNQASQHTFQILTKRSEKLLDLKNKVIISNNIWIGVSVENSDNLYRIKDLQKAQLKNSFISFEPLIGPILTPDLKGISWVIVGGESGVHARHMLIDWVFAIKDACEIFGVPFFFKQWGSKKSNPDNTDDTLLKRHPNYAMGGCKLEGVICQNLPSGVCHDL
jgi:protein gp37